MNSREIMRLSRNGDYIKLIELTMATQPGHFESFEDVYLRIQLGLAYQHAGVYPQSIRIYEEILHATNSFLDEQTPVNAGSFGFDGVSWKDVRYNLRLQIVVLLERIERVQEAENLFSSLSPPTGIIDLRIAKSTLKGWYFTTEVRLCLRRGRYSLLGDLAKRNANEKDQFVRLWAKFAACMFSVLVESGDLDQLETLNARFETLDPPGHPWFLLLEGEHLRGRSPEFSTKLFEAALHCGKTLGRFFVIASAAEGLYINHRAASADLDILERYLSQQMRSLHQCQLVADDPYRSRLREMAHRDLGWQDEDFVRVLTKTQGILQDRREFHIWKMCQEHAMRSGVDDDQIFEDFVSKWAEVRFPRHRVHLAPKDTPAVDVYCTRQWNNKTLAILIQAKLYGRPRKAANQKVQRIKEAQRILKIDIIEEYYFVVAKKGEARWNQTTDWHVQDTHKLTETVNVGKVSVYTEPMLQTDILEFFELRAFFH